jgi:erythrin-vacuolar iron transport family protein
MTTSSTWTEADVAHRREERSFLLQRVQPAMTRLTDGSLSTLAPTFAVAFATTSRATRSSPGWPPRSAPGSA